MTSEGPTAQGKRKMAKIDPRQGKHRGFINFVQTQGKQGNFNAQVVNSLILRVKDDAIFATKF